MKRYFVDQRCGCVAVRDHHNTEQDYPGLHPDTRGVMKYWHSGSAESVEEAEAYCIQLNAAEDRRDLPPSGVLQEWVAKLGLRHQGVLVSIIRGCDHSAKEDVGKSLTRALRGLILNTHCADPSKAVSFIETLDAGGLGKRFIDFFRVGFDHYPTHWLMHLVHAVEVLGYHHPIPTLRAECANAYLKFCKKLHVTAESLDELEARLNADEESFGKLQA